MDTTRSPPAENTIQALIADYERRAARVGKSIEEVYTEAGIHRATWNRWKAGTSEPRLGGWIQVDEVLKRLEKEAA